MSKSVILIPAAGASSRMGARDKLLEHVDGLPLLALMVDRALTSGADVYVALPSPDHPRNDCVKDSQARVVFVPDAQCGMGHSIAALIGALDKKYEAALILPADMPELSSEDLAKMLLARDEAPANAILRGAAQDGRPGHPVIFPASYFAALGHLSGDQGGRDILRAHTDVVQLVALPDQHALTDLDTPQDWDNWRKNNAFR